MSEARHLPRMTAEEFLVWQGEQDRNYELVDGIPVLPAKAMTGASQRHDTITVNVLITLGNQLRGKPCRPFTDDISVRNPSGNIRRPDILVDCGRNDRSTEAVDPRVVIEVLSPSTMRFDRLMKVEEYKEHPSISTILLIASETTEIIAWRRDDQRLWTSRILRGLAGSILLPEINAEIVIADIYEDTGLRPDPTR